MCANKSDLCEKDLYNILRDQVVHENELYYRRLGWFATAQGVLFAAAGLLLREAANQVHGSYTSDIYWFIVCIACASIYSCAVANTKLSEARYALKCLDKSWEDRPVKREKYPHIAGGIGPRADKSIYEAQSGYLPTLFALVWLAGLLLASPHPVTKAFVIAMVCGFWLGVKPKFPPVTGIQ